MKTFACALAISLMASTAMAQTTVGIAPKAVNNTSVNTVATSRAQLYGFDLTQGATAGYFAFLNVNTAPQSGASISPVACIYAGAGASARFRQDYADFYINGLTIVDTSNATCSVYTPITASVISASIQQ